MSVRYSQPFDDVFHNNTRRLCFLFPSGRSGVVRAWHFGVSSLHNSGFVFWRYCVRNFFRDSYFDSVFIVVVSILPKHIVDIMCSLLTAVSLKILAWSDLMVLSLFHATLQLKQPYLAQSWIIIDFFKYVFLDYASAENFCFFFLHFMELENTYRKRR